MLSIGVCDQIDKISKLQLNTVIYVWLESVFIIVWLILSVWVCPKVITISGLHYCNYKQELSSVWLLCLKHYFPVNLKNNKYDYIFIFILQYFFN